MYLERIPSDDALRGLGMGYTLQVPGDVSAVVHP